MLRLTRGDYDLIRALAIANPKDSHWAAQRMEHVRDCLDAGALDWDALNTIKAIVATFCKQSPWRWLLYWRFYRALDNEQKRLL